MEPVHPDGARLGPLGIPLLSSLHSLPAFERHAPGAFSLEPGTTALSRSDWRGNLGELSARHGGMIAQQDLNAVRYNHPIFDLRDHRGRLNQVKTSVRSADGRGDPFETYLRGLRDIVGLRPTTWERARARFRQQVAAANPHMTPAQVERWVFPELLMVARHGGGVRGNAVASGIAGGRGAVGGAVVSLICEGVHLHYEPQPDKEQRYYRAAVAGGTSGLTGGATQNLVTANAGSAMSRNLIARGANVRVAAGTGRAMGGFAGGALAAPIFTMTSLALDDEEHSGTDYVATGTRAFVAGGLSSAIAAGVVGALWGSEVPLLGNAVGFIIGFGGYYLVDALTGEQVEQGVRRNLDVP